MPKKKKKERKKKGRRSTDREPSSAEFVAPSIPVEDPFFTALLFAPLVLGCITASGLEPPKSFLFTLIIAALIFAKFLGSQLQLIRSLKPLADVAHSKRDLELSLSEARLQENQFRKRKKVNALLLAFLTLGSLTSVFVFSGSAAATTLLAFASICIATQFTLSLRSLRELVIHLCIVIIFPSTLPLLGIFSQVEQLPFQPFILGFVPGTLLAAALIARHGELFEKLGWSYSKEVTTKKGLVTLRPGEIGKLYSIMILLGPAVAFLLVITETFPPPVMFSVAILFLTPKLFERYIKLNGQEMYSPTLKLAGLCTLLMLVIGIASRG